ncbi:hypothetical protein SAMN05443247_01097 [Bradyrhizobium erythrophlei]|nr:hypothetical protein SAMN05443247_01097 [Bradyrhizobium erythrophlei]
MRHRANMLAPPPPSPEMAQSAAYRALPASTRSLLLLIEVDIADQGGMLATIDLDAACAASGLRKRALVAALNQLEAAGFIIIISRNGKSCLIALSSAWRQT